MRSNAAICQSDENRVDDRRTRVARCGFAKSWRRLDQTPVPILEGRWNWFEGIYCTSEAIDIRQKKGYVREDCHSIRESAYPDASFQRNDRRNNKAAGIRNFPSKHLFCLSRQRMDERRHHVDVGT
jgi:hypothetical protein